MLKILTQLFVSLIMFAGATIGIQADAPDIMSRIRADAKHSIQSVGDSLQGSSQLSGEAQGSTYLSLGNSDAEGEDASQIRSKNNRDAQGSAEGDVEIDLSLLKRPWKWFKGQLAWIMDQLQQAVKNLEFDATFRGQAEGSAQTQ